MRTPIAIACVALFTCSGACGGAPPPKEPEAAPQEVAPVVKRPAMKVRGQLGSLDPDQVKRAFSALDDQFMACQKQAIDRVEFVSGNVKFFLRIGEDGAAKWSYLEASDLGDQAADKCLLGVVMGAHWPKPDGGEGEARYSVDLPMVATRPPTDWSADKISAALAKHGEALGKCKAGSSARFSATMYVARGGKVLTAGVAAGGKDQQDEADCLAQALEKMKGLPSPGSWPAKVTFDL